MTASASSKSPAASNSGDPTNGGSPSLRASAVEKTFQGLVAVKEVTLTVNPREILGLIGPNGSGKTTFLNVVSGVLRPTGGEIAIEGKRSEGLAAHKVARLGVGRTFQQIRLFDSLSVRENVEVGAVAKGFGRESVEITDGVLERLGLAKDAQRPAGTLPYGDQRRVEIARAVAGRPSILLLDEPGAGMNEEESKKLFHTLTSIRTDFDCSVLIVDHNLGLITRLCERIHVLAEGKTIAEGSADEVQRDRQVIEAYIGRAAEGQNGRTKSRGSGDATA